LGRIILGSFFRQTANQVAQKNAVIASANSSSFVKKTEIPLGSTKWLWIVAPDEQDGNELL